MVVRRRLVRLYQFDPDVVPWPPSVEVFNLTGDYLVDVDQYGFWDGEAYTYVRPGDWIMEWEEDAESSGQIHDA